MKLSSFSSSSDHVVDRILYEMDDFGAVGHKKVTCLPLPAAKVRERTDKALRELSRTKRYRRMTTAYAPGRTIREVVLRVAFCTYA